MPNFWQDMDEVQTLSRIFLAIFVLIGLVPFFKRSFRRLYDTLKSLGPWRKTIIVPVLGEMEPGAADPSKLSDLEYLVFLHLAQSGAKGLSLPTLAQGLHMEFQSIAEALRSLNQRGLVAIAPGFALIKRFSLSRKGRTLALEKGVSVRMSAREKGAIIP